MKAWETEKLLMEGAKPKILGEDEQTWDAIEGLEKSEDQRLKMVWYSEVPGSAAPERLMVAAVQSMENMGYDVTMVEGLLPLAIDANNRGDMAELNRLTVRINYKLNNLDKDPNSQYWNYREYKSWDEYSFFAEFPKDVHYDVFHEEFTQRIYGGWMAQICGGALGTALEGYTTENIKEVFGNIRGYVRPPNTFNDDITYELAFLKAFEDKGYEVTSKDIAIEWGALIPFGWSAEDVALRNIKEGIFPPKSGYFNNPFKEWIGAQMRGAICGMVAPGRPKEAARLAWLDGEISHYNNGIIGEIFNAVMVSLAFVKNDVRKILTETINSIPKDSEYYSVVDYALKECQRNDSWYDAWKSCEKKLERYNWVHAYPNAAAEVIALWFGNGDFDETMHIIAMEGQDVDCNAAQIATIIGVIKGIDGIDNKWIYPIGDILKTYVRNMKELSIQELSIKTTEAVRKAVIF